MQAEGEIVQLPTERAAPPKDFRMFFEEEHGRLFKTLYFVTGDRADAADLMQEAFAKLWERWDTIDRIDDPTAYLFKVALNGNRMRLRAARRAARRPARAQVAGPPDRGERRRRCRGDRDRRLRARVTPWFGQALSDHPAGAECAVRDDSSDRSATRGAGRDTGPAVPGVVLRTLEPPALPRRNHARVHIRRLRAYGPRRRFG